MNMNSRLKEIIADLRELEEIERLDYPDIERATDEEFIKAAQDILKDIMRDTSNV